MHYHESFRTSIYLYIKGQLDLRCVQVKSEPHLSSGQMKFNFFFLPCNRPEAIHSLKILYTLAVIVLKSVIESRCTLQDFSYSPFVLR